MSDLGAGDARSLSGRPPRRPLAPSIPPEQDFADNAAGNSSSSPLSSRDRPWYPGQPLPPQVRPSRALLEASRAAAARAGVVSAPPLPAAVGDVVVDDDEDGESLTQKEASAKATTTPTTQPPPAPAPPPPSCALPLLPPATAAGDEGEYPLTPVDDEARSALVDEMHKACEPGDPELAAICRLLRSVLGVPMASVTLISHAQAWFRGGESISGSSAGGGGGGGNNGSCAAAAAAANSKPSSSSSVAAAGTAGTAGGTGTEKATSDPDPMPRGRVLCAYSLIGEPDVRRRGEVVKSCFSFPLSFLYLSLSFRRRRRAL